VRFGSPGLRPELDHISIGHLGVRFPEMDVHFPVAAVEVAIVQFKLEGTSIPNVAVSLGSGKGILGPALDNPVALLFVAIPHHQASLHKAATNELNPLVDMRSLTSYIMSS